MSNVDPGIVAHSIAIKYSGKLLGQRRAGDLAMDIHRALLHEQAKRYELLIACEAALRACEGWADPLLQETAERLRSVIAQAKGGER